MKRVFLDESGYTGRDLLNRDQPFLVLSALCIDDDVAEKIRQTHFPRLAAAELKFSNLKRRISARQPLLDLQLQCINDHMAITFVADKKYMCILKMLDDCLEPDMHDRGFNFYQDGTNHGLASLIYMTGDAFWGTDNFNKLLKLYQIASANKDRASLTAFSKHAQRLLSSDIGIYLEPIASLSKPFIQSILSPETNTNVAASMLHGIISRIEVLTGEPYELIHDTSPAMRKHHDLLHTLSSATEPVEFHVSDITTVSYPLQLDRVTEGDSEKLAGLQLADVLAGAAALACVQMKQDPQSEWAQSVIKSYPDSQFIHILPAEDPREIKDRFAGSQVAQVIDYATIQAAKSMPPKS